MNDHSSNADPPVEASPSGEQVIEGVGVAPGIAIGRVYRYDPAPPEVQRRTIAPEEVEEELELFGDAVDRAERELETVQGVAHEALGADGQAIFEAQAMMLRDEEVLRAVRDRIRNEHQSAGAAVQSVLRDHRRRLESSDDDYLRERVEELEELETRLLQGLQRGKVMATIKPGSIIVAEALTAADVIRFNRHGMLGCITTRGGATSHVSIIARALGVPAIVGAEGAMEQVADHDPVVLDSLRGHLIVHPSADTLEHYRQRRARHQTLVKEQAQTASLPGQTTDGWAVTLRANVEFEEEFGVLEQYGADGIGLLRTEVMFLAGPDGSLSEELQAHTYRKAARAAGEEGATIRLLDLGGDKLLPFAPREDNPFLGWRGLRVLLDRPDELLRPQLRALLRANAHGSLRALLPMVTHLDEVRRVRAVLEEEASRLADEDVEHDPELPLGVMVEVPAVAIQAEAFANVADFLSIGTNDLTQYVLAIDRGNDRVAAHYDALHPAVLRLIRRTANVGRQADLPVAVCGEIASDIQALPILLGLGIDTLSASPTFLPAVKRVLRQVSRAEARSLADEALQAPDIETVRCRAREWIDAHVDVDFLPDSSSPAEQVPPMEH